MFRSAYDFLLQGPVPVPVDTAMDPESPIGWRIRTVEMHTAGEPVRIVVSGLPPIEGDTLLDKRRYCRDSLDRFRRLLMGEPRGHRDMFGAVLVPADDPKADAAALFIHNEGYCTMCGHASMAVVRYLVDEGVVPRAETGDTEVNLQCPCGLVRAWLTQDNQTRFLSVPAFVLHKDLSLPLPDGRQCRMDISYGGSFYAVVRAGDLGLNSDSPSAEYVRQASYIRRHLSASGVKIHHPDSADLGFLFGVVFADFAPLSVVAPPPEVVSQVIVFADGQVDRSPCGSGTTACCAVLHTAGRLPTAHGCTFRCALTGSEFNGRVAREIESHGRPAVVVQVSGRSFYTGRAEYLVEAEDPLGEGFLVQ
ncbi:trans-3-hydroxy-L-proline dehydratase-like isoform X2 [Amphibalanus amphitrite]|uniref:trans-3-hydroxy-L-proline dehydratase-like isoform X2 n=2 Tax=Amphibalanus amphitrite TaxID=1232801 RepID=UPI001C91C43D|nr:trans-3-hydroxy-L-proline dehydratase-like isoform X2 [Amphibalanus amphitrite]